MSDDIVERIMRAAHTYRLASLANAKEFGAELEALVRAALSERAEAVPTQNPNNCAGCKHKQHPDGGWCYMFRDEPTDVCMKHTARIAAPEASERAEAVQAGEAHLLRHLDVYADKHPSLLVRQLGTALRKRVAAWEAAAVPVEVVQKWQALYRRAFNEACALTNYVEDRPELRRSERNIAAIEAEARALATLQAAEPAAKKEPQ